MHLTLTNEKSVSFFLFAKLAFNIQQVFTCLKSGRETPEQVMKYVDFEKVNTALVSLIVEWNVFQAELK